MLYRVFLDPYGPDDIVEPLDHVPTESEEALDSQAVGYIFAGYFEADSLEEALAMGERFAAEYGTGCIA